MTGTEALNKSLTMLGYSNSNGNLVTRLKERSLVLINLVYSDLWRIYKESDFKPLEKLSDKIDLPERALNDVFLYGLCMFLAQSESDADNQALWSRLYNQKRTSLSKRQKIVNTIPTVY